jgi:signal transduction histidine kinase/ligand-binding sensor domain-containing protein
MHRLTFLRLIIFLFACLCGNIVQAQYYFDKLTEENGLSDNRVTCFLKDKTGFLWIGTKNGLNRYDGNTFSIFKPSSGNSISNEEINDIVQDTSGKIWVATMAGLNVYDPETNHWETMMPSNSYAKGDLPSYLIWDLFVDEKNGIWIVSDVWDLSVYDPVAKKFTYYDWPSVREQSQFHKLSRYRSIQKIERKNENEWWLATTIGLFSLDTRSKQFTFHGSGYTGSIKDIKYDRLHNIVFAVTEDGRLFSFDANKNRYQENQLSYQAFPAVIWNSKTETKNLLLLAYPRGMLEINPGTKEATVILHRPNLSSSLLPGETTNIYIDNSGIVWVGTGNGINYFNSHNRIADFIPLENVSDKESMDEMSAAFYDSVDQRYYITSIRSKKVFIIDSRTGLISAIQSSGGKPFSACLNVCMDKQNNIWLLTETNVYRYNRSQQQFIVFPMPGDKSPSTFTDMIEDKEGDYWFSSWQKGLYRYKTKEKKFQWFTEKDNVYSKNITSLVNDPIDNAVWIGTFNDGTYRYDRQKDSITVFKETSTNTDYLQLNLIRDVETDVAGKVWFTTFGAGLYVYTHGRSYERSFTHITAKDGLSNSNYYSITADNKNRLWLLSGKGLSAIDTSGKFLYDASKHPAIQFANYAPENSYPKRIFYNRIDDEILIPVSGGLLLYYPDKNIPPAGFPLALTDISIGGRSVMHDSSYRSKDHIEIPFSSGSLSFRFAALTYSGHENIHYEYTLRKNDTVWKSLGISNTANFPDLSPGYYVFKVRARDAVGNLSANTVSFSFRVIPPFWKTWWFITTLIVLLGYFFYRWTVYLRHKIKAQKILNYFATSLYGQNTVEDICWDVAKNCMSQLKLSDCVIYLYDPQKKVLMQKAAYGAKNPEKHEIVNAIEIPLGKGIVGTVAKTGKAEIIRDTSKDSRYIMDDERRQSEIAVPISVEGRIFGVIDSEHPRKNFYRKYHLRILQDIAAICSDKISKYIIEERLRSKISRDLHDEIGSALTSINVLSKVALSKAGNDTEISNYLSKIKDSTFQTMESMSDIVWAINPKNDKLEALMSRMKEFAADICEAKGIDLSFTLPEELEKLSIDLGARKNLFLVFKEAVNNAVKYSACSLLRIRFERTSDQLQMEIQDNGKGFDMTTVARGNGLYNMQERAAECDGHLHIGSSAGHGTAVILQVPITRFGVSAES